MAREKNVTPHGGDLSAVAREFGIPVEGILDFSSNVNPRGLPPRAAERLAREATDPRTLCHYPDPRASELRALLSRRLDVDAENIAVGGGAASLILAAVRSLAPRRCVIPVPAFSEYERACRACGCEIQFIPLTTNPDLRAGDLMILNNPHNPTGACATRQDMLDSIAIARSAGASVLVDGAFVDYAPAAAITREATAQENVIAIRSLTKFYGCPGLRVGYAVAAAQTARRLAAQLPSWPVTTLALNALAEALRDDDYVRQTLEENHLQRTNLAAELAGLGCCVFPSAGNFLFFCVPDAFSAIHVRERLIRHHRVLVRECDSFQGLEPDRYLRVAVRRQNENARLVEALRSALAPRIAG